MKPNGTIGFVDYSLKAGFLIKSESERESRKDFKSAFSFGLSPTPPCDTFFIKGSIVGEGFNPSE